MDNDATKLFSIIQVMIAKEVERQLLERFGPPDKTEDEWLTTKQVAAITKLTPWRVCELHRRGILKAEKPYGEHTRTLRWRKSKVENYIQTGFVKGSN